MSRLFGKTLIKEYQAKSSKNLASVANMIGRRLNRLAIDIFKSYRQILMDKPITYIVPAVWGIIQGGELDDTQRKMNSTISPALEDIIKFFKHHELSMEQEFAIRYLVNGYFISKIVYMIELCRNRRMKTDPNLNHEILLEGLEPIGHA